MTVNALSQFRLLLDHFHPTDRGDVLRYFRLLAEVGDEAVEELRPRVLKAITDRDLRFLIMETVYYYPWLDWVEPLARILRHESDLEVFEAGARALAHMRHSLATSTLKELYGIRHAPAFQELLSRALNASDPKEAFKYHLDRLMGGSANPQVANAAVVELSRIVDAGCLPAIQPLVRHEDLLISRHALKLITLIPTAEAAQFLLDYLLQLHKDALEDRDLKEILADFKILPSTGLRELVLQQARARLGAKAEPACAALEREDMAAATLAVEALKPLCFTQGDQFLAAVLGVAAEGKFTRLSTLVKDGSEAMHRRGRWMASALDRTAEGLQLMVAKGLAPYEDAKTVMAAAFEKQTGREGLAHALGAIVRADDAPLLDLILTSGDSALRGAALEAIGARRDPGMLPCLQRACRDPIVEIAEKAIASFGLLPGSLDATLDLLHSSDPYEARLGVHIAASARMEPTVQALLDFIAAGPREEFLLEAYTALGRIGSDRACAGLLEALHSGQSLRTQVVLATALKETGQGHAYVSLAEAALTLRNAQVHALAAEALLILYDDAVNPMPAELLPLLRAQIKPCWEDKDTWPLRIRLIPLLGSLNCSDPDFYDEMAAMIAALLNDKRNASAWTTEQQGVAAVALRSLEQRAARLRSSAP